MCGWTASAGPGQSDDAYPQLHPHEARRSAVLVEGVALVRVPRDPRCDGSIAPEARCSDEPLTIAPTQPRRGLVLVRLIGEVDMLTAPRFGEVVQNALVAVAAERDRGGDPAHDDPPLLVVCDLSGVTFFGASGLDVVASAQRTADEHDVRLVVVAGHRTVLRPFRLVALDSLVHLTATHPAIGRHVVAGPAR